MYPPLAFGPADVGGTEIVVIGVIALLLFGKNLPAQARNLGRAIAAFKQTINQASSELHREMDAAAEGVSEVASEIKDEIKKDDPTAGVAEAVNNDSATAGLSGSAAPDGNPAPDTGSRTPDAGTQVSSLTPQVSSPAISEAAALDALPRNIPPPSKIPPPVM